MKKQFTPIAMLCTLEQYHVIKQKLEKAGLQVESYESFECMPYLVNNCNSKKYYISNVQEKSKNDNGRTVHEQWNEKVFLEACGIETEPEFVITKEQILNLCNPSLYTNKERLQELFPAAFKTVLEVGNWYKNPIGSIVFSEEISNSNEIKGYGINSRKEWCYTTVWFDKGEWSLMTQQEIEEALKAEAVKRGFGKAGVCFKDGYNSTYEVSNIEGFDFWNKHLVISNKSRFNISVGKSGCVIFRGTNGKWAEIIPTITKEQAEKELGKKIID